MALEKIGKEDKSGQTFSRGKRYQPSSLVSGISYHTSYLACPGSGRRYPGFWGLTSDRQGLQEEQCDPGIGMVYL
jgi:hypothetical protein